MKKKTKRFKVFKFRLLLVVFKSHLGSEGVKRGVVSILILNVLSATQGHLRTANKGDGGSY